MPAPQNHAITRNVVQLKALPHPDHLTLTAGRCLLTDSGSAHTNAVATALRTSGWDVATLQLPAVFDEAGLQQSLGQFGRIHALIHLDGSGDAATSLKQLFFIAKHLRSSLDVDSETRPTFMTVSQLDGALGLAGENNFDPIRGGLFGLTKTMGLEWPDIYCRALDLHPDYSADDVAALVSAELHDPNRLISEVGYGSRGRVTLDTATVELEAYTPNAAITPNSVFVVSGGGKGITADCVLHLARQYACKFILLGRSSIADVDISWVDESWDEPALKRGIMQHLLAKGEKPNLKLVGKMARSIGSKLEINRTLAAIAATGGSAEYVSVDVTNATAVQAALADAASRLGKVTGLIHGAGVLSDKLIEKKTEWDFDAVYNTKVAGLHALLSAVPAAQLEQLVLFSSAAGFYGNVGQADYSVANEILNKTAHSVQLAHPNCHTVAIDWGPWDGGMVTPVLKKLFAERNIPVIPIEVGAWILTSELTTANAAVTQTVVGGELIPPAEIADLTLKSHRIQRALRLDANPFLRDHVIGGNPVLPTVCAIAWMGNACEQLYPGYTLFACDNYQVLKGIVFDDAAQRMRGGAQFDCILDLEEVEKSAESVTIKAVIWSRTGRITRYHYRAEMTLLHKLPDAPIYDGVDLTSGATIDKATIYGDMLFHGPLFQGVEEVLNITPEKVTMRCYLPPMNKADQGQFPVQSFNPYFADGQFQSMVIWARRFQGAGSLPLMTKRGVGYRPIPFGEVTYTTMEVKSNSGSKLIADIITHDADGRIYTKVSDATVTISPALNHLFVAHQP
ncbi:MAG: SDR family NAD(P)-dependent oxidoreductase [Candidatus Promineifilaceae bacterium]